MNLICRLLGHRKVWLANWQGFNASENILDGCFHLQMRCSRCYNVFLIGVVHPMRPRSLRARQGEI